MRREVCDTTLNLIKKLRFNQTEISARYPFIKIKKLVRVLLNFEKKKSEGKTEI